MSPGSPSLTQRTARALGFRMLGHVGVTTLTIGFGVVLARLLPPAEFGLFAVAAATVEIADLLGGSGMLEALIQKRGLTGEHEAAGAFVQLASAGLLGTLLALAAAPAERLFGMPGLAGLLRVQALVLPLTALALLPASRLSRELAFGPVATGDVVLRLLCGTVAVALALHGAGAIALVYGSVAGALGRTVFLWAVAPVRVSPRFGLRHVRELYRFGTGIVLIGVSNVLARRVDVLIIGARLGSELAGLYQRAFQLVLMPLDQLTSPVTKVLFPAMASVHEDRERLGRAYLVLVRLSALVGFPLMTFLWIAGDLLILVAYGPWWVGAASILRLLAISGYFRIAYRVHGLLVQASGHPMREGVRQAIYLGLVVVLAFAGSRFGIEGVVGGVVVAAGLFFLLMTQLALRLSGLTWRQWAGAMRTALAASLILGAVLVALRTAVGDGLPAPSLCLLQCVAAAASYALALRWLCTRADQEVIGRVSAALPSRVGRAVRAAVAIDPAAAPIATPLAEHA